MSYQTIYEITANLPNALVQVWLELFPCYSGEYTAQVIGGILVIIALAVFPYLVFILVLTKIKHGDNLKRSQIQANSTVHGRAWGAVNLSALDHFGCIACSVCIAFAVALGFLYYQHLEFHKAYSDGTNVAELSGTVRDLVTGLRGKYTVASFHLGNQGVNIYSTHGGFNNPLHPIIHNGAELKIWLFRNPRTNEEIVLRLDAGSGANGNVHVVPKNKTSSKPGR